MPVSAPVSETRTPEGMKPFGFAAASNSDVRTVIDGMACTAQDDWQLITWKNDDATAFNLAVQEALNPGGFPLFRYRVFGQTVDWAEVREGDKVSAGTPIGALGNTGLSTGPHLHYEVHVNGRPVDPLRYVLPDVITE